MRQGLSAAYQINPMQALAHPPMGLGLLSAPETLTSGQTKSLANALMGEEWRWSRPYYLESWAVADFGQELQRPFWTIETGVPLLLGIAPVFAPSSELLRNKFTDQIAFEATRLRSLVADAQQIGDLHEWFRPAEFITWALGQGIPVPPALLTTAVTRGLPIKGHPSQLDMIKAEFRALQATANKDLEARSARIAELEREVATQRAEIAALSQRQQREGTVSPEVGEDSTKAPSGKTNLSGLSRKHNYMSALFYLVLQAKFGIVVGSMHKPDVRGLMAVLSQHGFEPDDETLAGYVQYGAEQAARLRKSPPSERNR